MWYKIIDRSGPQSCGRNTQQIIDANITPLLSRNYIFIPIYFDRNSLLDIKSKNVNYDKADVKTLFPF